MSKDEATPEARVQNGENQTLDNESRAKLKKHWRKENVRIELRVVINKTTYLGTVRCFQIAQNPKNRYILLAPILRFRRLNEKCRSTIEMLINVIRWKKTIMNE